MAAGTAAALAFLNQESRARAGAVGGPRVPAPVTMDSFFFGIEDGGGRGWHGADETVGRGSRLCGVGVGRGLLACPACPPAWPRPPAACVAQEGRPPTCFKEQTLGD